MLLEFILPSLVVIFFGLGAWVVSLAHYLGLVDTWQTQLLLFSVASLVSLFLLRKYLKNWFVGDSKAEDDEMRTEFIDKVVVVTADIPGGVAMGRVELKGADWKAYSDVAHKTGDMVKVIERDGLNLKVEATN